MAINLEPLNDVAITATTLSALILITPNKNKGIQAQKIPGTDPLNLLPLDEAFLFDFNGEEFMNLATDITDHYVEDNTTRQDQMALKPEKFTVTGFVSEVNDVTPKALVPLRYAADKLAIIGGYTPEISVTAAILYNEAKYLYDSAAAILNNTVQSWQSITNGSPIKSRQETAYLKFYGYWSERRLFTVQTPWCLYKDMAIETVKVVQNSESVMVSDFEITFKKMRFASTKIIKPNQALGTDQSGRAAASSSQVVDFGNQTPVSVGDKMASFLSGVK